RGDRARQARGERGGAPHRRGPSRRGRLLQPLTPDRRGPASHGPLPRAGRPDARGGARARGARRAAPGVAARAPVARVREEWQRLALVVFGLLVGVVVLEIGLRIAGSSSSPCRSDGTSSLCTRGTPIASSASAS